MRKSVVKDCAYDMHPLPEGTSPRAGAVPVLSRFQGVSPMSSNTKRLNMIISDDLDRLIDELAEEAHTSRTDVVRRALAVMKAYREQRKMGRTHIGFAEQPDGLDAEILNVLD